MIKRTLIALVATLALATGSLAADAAANWDNHCSSCHGADGKGQTKMGKKLKIEDLTDAHEQSEFTDEEAFKAIKEGLKDDGKTKMKPVEGLSDDEIHALVAYVRSLKR